MVALITSELEVSEELAERKLREHGGDALATLRELSN